jgi:phage terminase large subunit-like protein
MTLPPKHKAKEEQLFKEKYYALLKQQEQDKYKHELPHLFSYKFYKWSRKFFDSDNRMNLLFAANQISKSSTQIRKCIHWATATKLWPLLWKGKTPNLFWYFMPDAETIRTEIQKKWIPEWLPRGDMKNHPQFGWEVENLDSKTKLPIIHFNSGISVYFKTYGQKVANIQSSTVYAVFCDEELPENYYDEIKFRLAATDGYFHMVCTPTLGQQFWKDAIEPASREKEKFPDALKQQVSMYDCLEYEDGSESPWTTKRIKLIESDCRNELEIQKRVHGRFIREGRTKYGDFDPHVNVVAPYDISGWHLYAGVDIGTGGGRHPASIVFVAVRPDYKKAAVYQGWRGDNALTASGDILEKFREMRGSQKFIGQFYDHHARDFFIVASRIGEPFIPAEKGQDLGTDMINTLFKNRVLDIFDLPELSPLVDELLNLHADTPKKDAVDDYIDGMRYAITRIPWDWTAVGDNLVEKADALAKKVVEEHERNKGEIVRRREMMLSKAVEQDTIESEIDFWSSQYE